MPRLFRILFGKDVYIYTKLDNNYIKCMRIYTSHMRAFDARMIFNIKAHLANKR